jgi:Fe-S oxidoreductase
MPDPTTVSYFGLPGYVFLWLIAIVSFFFFVRRIARLIRALNRARPEMRWDRMPRRIRTFVTNVFVQPRIFNERTFGAAHFFIFWAFVFYASSFFWNLIRGLFPVVPLPYADDVPFVAFMMEILTVIGLAGLVVMAVRRYILTPEGLERTFDASLVLVLIAALFVSFLGMEGAKGLTGEHASAWTPAGNLLGRGLAVSGVDPESAQPIFSAMWWLHMATVLFFLAYLPYSKHGHLIFSPFAVFFASLRPGSMPPPSEGAARLEDFTWRQVFSGLACAECGRCDRSCPAYNSGFPLSPKDLIHEMKHAFLASLPAESEARASSDEGSRGGNGKRFVGDVIAADAIWACTSCLACMDRCPVFNEHVPILTEMRRHLVTEGELDERVQEVLMNMTRYGNSFGKSPRARARWAKGLDFKIKDARKEPVEYLWYVGDYASFDPRMTEITRTTAEIFHQAGLDFGILHEGEQNTGNDIRRVGEEGLFDLLREKNRGVLEKASFRRIVTTDPHTYHALKHEYGSGLAGENGMEVLHYTELLDELLHEGRLQIRNPLEGRLTYHDPCYLGRYNGVYKQPRRVLESLGRKVVEMPRNRSNAYCCGAGGGRIWMEDVAGVTERPAESRVREAAGLDGVSTLVVSCPKDLVMFQDALKTTGLDDKLVIKDVMELVAEAVRPIEEE